MVMMEAFLTGDGSIEFHPERDLSLAQFGCVSILQELRQLIDILVPP
jgi:hypothetical protein